MDIYKLYPQFVNDDRRQQNIPVDVEKRSNIDRRQRAENQNVADKRVNPVLRNDIERVKDVFKSFNGSNNDSLKHDAEIGAVSSIPFVRRFNGIYDAITNHDYFKAGGTAILLFMNVKEDWRDIVKIFKKPNTPYDFQIPFSFIRGTPLEEFEVLDKYDKTLADTKFAKKFLKAIGMKKLLIFNTNQYNKSGDPIFALKTEGTLLSKIMHRTQLRIPLLSLLFVSMLEIPTIIKSNDPVNQTKKSAINVISTIFMGALLGAIGAYAGPLGSLAGLGIGTYFGNKFAKALTKN